MWVILSFVSVCSLDAGHICCHITTHTEPTCGLVTRSQE